MQARLIAHERYSLKFFPRITREADYRPDAFVVGARFLSALLAAVCV
jgi:hypothetical protein